MEKILSSLSLCCLEEGASCSPEPIAGFKGTAHSRVRPLPPALHVAGSSVEQTPADGSWAEKRLQGPAWPFSQALKVLTWVWGADAFGEVEAHPFSKIPIPFKDMCPASPNRGISAALV